RRERDLCLKVERQYVPGHGHAGYCEHIATGKLHLCRRIRVSECVPPADAARQFNGGFSAKGELGPGAKTESGEGRAYCRASNRQSRSTTGLGEVSGLEPHMRNAGIGLKPHRTGLKPIARLAEELHGGGVVSPGEHIIEPGECDRAARVERVPGE